MTFRALGGVKRPGPWDGKVLDAIGAFGGAGLLGTSGVYTWITVARSRWEQGESVPLPVHVVGVVGIVLVGAALFAVVMGALILQTRSSDIDQERRISEFQAEVGHAASLDPSIVRVWVLHPFVIRSNPPLRSLLAVATSGEPRTDFEPLRKRAQLAADLPELPELLVGPEDSLEGRWQMARRYGHCVFDRERLAAA